jgi:glycolate oxidase FAD binding subunit
MEVAQAPSTREELARLLAAAGEAGTPVRFDGGGTKAGWAAPAAQPLTDLPTTGLDRIVEHNAGDLTAVLDGGVTLAAAQKTFAGEEQMLALDPPDDGATIGGIVATADSGPLRSRYGGVRDLVVGMRVALSDGTLAKSGGKVIKNVAGYDLAKLFTGSYGTLGAIVEVSVRLHPLQPSSATAVGSADDLKDLGRAAITLSREPFEHSGFDVRWAEGRGALLMRFAGAAPGPQAEAAARMLSESGLRSEIVEDDKSLWEEQRARQRAGDEDEAVVRVSGLPALLPTLVEAAEHAGGGLVGRAGLGLYWLRVPGASANGLETLREQLSPHPCVILDRPPSLDIDPWGPVESGSLELMRRIKNGFDRAGVCSPGTYVGGL